MKDRPTGGISEPKEPFAHENAPMEDLLEIIRCEDNFFFKSCLLVADCFLFLWHLNSSVGYILKKKKSARERQMSSELFRSSVMGSFMGSMECKSLKCVIVSRCLLKCTNAKERQKALPSESSPLWALQSSHLLCYVT